MSATRQTLVHALAVINAIEEQAAAVKRAVEAALLTEISDTPPAYCYGANPDLWQLQALAREFHINEATLRRWMKKHDLGQLIGGRWYVSRSRLQAFIALGSMS